MLLVDVNVLVYAFREDTPGHSRYAEWLGEIVNGAEPFGLADLVLSSFVRITTNPRIFEFPSSVHRALDFAGQLRSAPPCVRVSPGARHWAIFDRLCRDVGAHGNLITDAFLAAIAIESDSEWIATDRDYGRFPGLRWRTPF